MPPPAIPETFTVNYRVQRDELVRIWWRRMTLRPRILGGIATLLGVAVFCFIVRDGMEYAGFVLLLFAALTPVKIYRAVARAVDGNSQYTDPKSLEFSPSRLVVKGPDWRSELPWTTFKGFSEDPNYFYLHLSENGFASVLPKDAFTSESQQKFREYATTRKH